MANREAPPGTVSDIQAIRGDLTTSSKVLKLDEILPILEKAFSQIQSEGAGDTGQSKILKILGVSPSSTTKMVTGSDLIASSLQAKESQKPPSVEPDQTNRVPIAPTELSEQDQVLHFHPNIVPSDIVPSEPKEMAEVVYEGTPPHSPVVQGNPLVFNSALSTSLATPPPVTTLSETQPEVGNELTAQGKSLAFKGLAQAVSEGSGRVSLYVTGGTKTPLALQVLPELPKVGDAISQVLTSDVLVGLTGVTTTCSVVSHLISIPLNLDMRTTANQRKEMAQLMLDTPKERDHKIETLMKQVEASPTSEELKTKLQTLVQNIHELKVHPPSEMAKAIARQIIESASPTFKAIKAGNSVVGLGSSAVTIAVLAGAVSTPVGWAVSGVSALGSGALFVYNSRSASSRQEKIAAALTTFDAKYMAENNASRAERSSHDSLTARSAITKATVELLTHSPEAGARFLLKGLEVGDPGAKFIAHQVLGISESQYQELNSQGNEQILLDLFKLGMPLKPNW
ncbi:MAG: hypothetical protein AB7I41_04185 [Candidatus Sericytochromatia bacterium]